MEDLRPFGRRPLFEMGFPLCARVVLALLATGKHGFAAGALGRACTDGRRRGSQAASRLTCQGTTVGPAGLASRVHESAGWTTGPWLGARLCVLSHAWHLAGRLAGPATLTRAEIQRALIRRGRKHVCAHKGRTELWLECVWHWKSRSQKNLGIWKGVIFWYGFLRTDVDVARAWRGVRGLG